MLQAKYLNNIVEQDQHAIKRVTRPILHFKSFRPTNSELASIQLIHIIREGLRLFSQLWSQERTKFVIAQAVFLASTDSVSHTLYCRIRLFIKKAVMIILA
jgi:transposase-like protein